LGFWGSEVLRFTGFGGVLTVGRCLCHLRPSAALGTSAFRLLDDTRAKSFAETPDRPFLMV
jgi:hypothetical protein